MFQYDLYMQQLVQPMRDELTRVGFKELRTPQEVEEALGPAEGTVLVFVNSVCGCAAGIARPAAALALQHDVVPDRLYTVFAGQDREATAKAREYFEGYPPSSPSIALLRDGKVVHFIPRERIETREPGEIAQELKEAFDQHCRGA
ncbi:bacilliredoxin BrxA [Bacillaceae bacterium]